MTLQGTSNNSGINMEHAKYACLKENVLLPWYCFGAFILPFHRKYNANQITMNIYLIPAITNNYSIGLSIQMLSGSTILKMLTLVFLTSVCHCEGTVLGMRPLSLYLLSIAALNTEC